MALSTKHRDRPRANIFATAISLTFLGVLWVAGGASRADAAGQAVVRFAAVGLLVVLILSGRRFVLGRAAPIAWLLLASAVLVALQLVPLPPAWWQAMPGHARLVPPIADIAGQWRPLAIMPSGALNALFSLVIPATALAIFATSSMVPRAQLLTILIVLAVLSMLLGLLQFSGLPFNHPLVNDSDGAVSGSFANRNHLALFLAMGCLLTPVWAFTSRASPTWRVVAGPGLMVSFFLTILASGSRSGLILGALGSAIGVFLAWEGIKTQAARYPRRRVVTLAVIIAVICLIIILLSLASGRAISVDRLIAGDTMEDMRTRAFPVVWAMTKQYFPWGIGFGGFDAGFRIVEPFELLTRKFFNHAHNDFIEVLLDGGLLGGLILLVAVAWWLWNSIAVWTTRATADNLYPRLGSGVLLLAILASAVDYPVRTPMIMGVVIIAAVWLADHSRHRREGTALPSDARLL